ncbi:hypothetical protein [Brevibacillus fortis]|uniref:hypothetical protein n=1 Tax=Brevibacillus fortis TaxID=2126352 RepID=UPI0038FC1236
MGSEFTAIFEHKFKVYEDILNFKNVLNSSVHFKKILFNDIDTETKGYVDVDWNVGYTQGLKDPLDKLNQDLFTTLMFGNRHKLIIGKNLCEYSCLVAWNDFLTNRFLQSEIRKICFEFSKFLGTPIYLPDQYCYSDYVYDGNSMQDIIKSLEREFRHPLRILEFNESEYEESRVLKVYLIDSFENYV